MTIHELCTLINGARPKGQSLASAIRVYLLDFYRKGGTSQRRPNEDPANDTGAR
jgi:predicted DNA-binding ribbon-helix-helix protein